MGKRKFALASFWVSLLVAAPAHAIDITDRFTLSGFIEYEHFSYVQDNEPGKIDGRNEIQFHTEWVFTPNADVKAFVAPEFRFDGNDEDRNRIFLDEAYIDLYTETMDWRIGKQIIAWGRADTMRPTDVWKVRDFTDFFQEEEEGIVGVQAKYFVGDATITGIWVPYFQPDTLPLANARSRFFFFPTTGVLGTVGCAPNPLCIPDLSGAGPYTQVNYAQIDTGLPDDSVESSEGGVKIEYTHEGWDFSLSYAFLHDRIPTFVEGFAVNSPGGALVLEDDGAANAVLGIRPVHKRLHMIGTDGATTLDKLGLRWEAAYFVTENRDENPANPIDNPYLKLTAGIDYTFTNLVGDDDLMILIQYVTDVELPKRGTKNIAQQANLRHFFEHGILAVAEWKFSEWLKFTGRGFINVLNADHSIEPELEWSPADGLTLTLAGTIAGGTGGENSFFTFFEDDDRVEAAARFSF